MHSEILQSIAVSLVLGTAGMLLGRWLRVPALLFFLGFGVLCGPAGLRLIHLDAFGQTLLPMVEVGVAIIVFEAGLALPLDGWRSAPIAIPNMLGVTLPLTGLAATGLAHWLVGLPLASSLLFGSLIVVTGPTVIGPMLRDTPLSRRVETVLRWESVWADCIGVVLSGVMLENALARYDGVVLPILFVARAAGGLAVGGLCGLLLSRWLLPWTARLGDQNLPGVTALSAAIGVFFLANALVGNSGVFAVAVAGMVLARARVPELDGVKQFKDQVSTLVIGFLFVLLSAQIDLRVPAPQWKNVLLAAALLTFVVRPLATFAALEGSSLRVGERAYVGLMGPRGIISAVVAAYFAIALRDVPLQGDNLHFLVFVTIMVSGGAVTVLGKPLARLFGVRLAEFHTGVAIIGVDRLAEDLAAAWKGRIEVVLIDADPTKCAAAAAGGHESRCENALTDALYESLVEEGFRRVLVKTPNAALNNMIARKAAQHVGIDRVFLASKSEQVEKSLHGLPEKMLAFAKDGLDLNRLNAELASGVARIAVCGRGLPTDAVAFASLTPDGGVRLLRSYDDPATATVCLTSTASTH